MVADKVNGLENRSLGIVEAVQPGVQVNAAMAHQADMLLVDASLPHKVQHLGGIHSLNPAAGVADDHYLIDSQLINCHNQAADGAVKRVGDDSAGILYQLDVPVLYAEGGRKQGDKAGVHTSNDGNFLVRIFGSLIFLIFPGFNEIAVELQHFFNLRHKTLV